MLSKLNLTNDYLFCRLFGDRGNRDILLSLVNAVLEDKGFPKLLGVRLINPTLYGDTIRAKTGILDLHAVDDEGRRYDIEIQVKNELNYIKRSIFYLARMYHQQLLRGKNYGTLKRTRKSTTFTTLCRVTINIMLFFQMTLGFIISSYQR